MEKGMQKKNAAGIVFSALLLALSLFLVFGTLFLFHACGAKDDGTFMHCHDAQTAVVITGAVLAAMSLALLAIPNRIVKIVLSAAAVMVSVLAMLLPGTLISMCMMAEMRCRSLMQPCVIAVSAAILVVALAIIFVYAREVKKHGRR